MSQAPPKILKLLTVAAELRAAGDAWEVVARRLKRHVRTCRHWPVRYAADWRRLYRRAEAATLAAAAAESIFILRQLLRSEDDKVRRDVGKLLLTAYLSRLARKGKRQSPPRGGGDSRAADLFRSLTDADMQSLLDEFGLPTGLPGPDAKGTGGPPVSR